jgi:threonine/homoserine/homoserine lactone efflux protein
MIGFGLGFFSSVPIGALGAYMIHRFIKNGFWDGLIIGVFASIMDAFYCAVSLVGMAFIYNIPILRFVVQVLGFLVLLYLGVRQILSSSEISRLDGVRGNKRDKNDRTWSRYIKDLTVVFSLGISNPTLWAFWTNVSHFLHLSILKGAAISEYPPFIMTVGMGSMICQYLSLRLLRRIYDHHREARAILYRISSLFYLVTVVYLGYHLGSEFLTLYKIHS